MVGADCSWNGNYLVENVQEAHVVPLYQSNQFGYINSCPADRGHQQAMISLNTYIGTYERTYICTELFMMLQGG